MNRQIVVAVLIAFVVAGGGCSSPRPQPPAASADGTPAVLAALLPPPRPEAMAEYRISPGDEFDVKFPYQPEMNATVTVRPDGRVDLPATGEIMVVGLTVTELQETIRRRSAEHLRNPEVVIQLKRIYDQKVYIGGEVRRPGPVLLRPDMTVLQAIFQTGGFLPTAKRDSVLLVTQTGGGKMAAARVDMAQVEDDGVSERVRLHPNDVIFVPRTWIGDANLFVDQWIRGLIPVLPRVGVGYNLSDTGN